MPLKIAALLIAVLGLAIATAGIWYHRYHPREVVSTGHLVVSSRRPSGPMHILRTRAVTVGAVRLDEIEMPNGTWIDCSGDCRRAAQDAGPDFWEAQARDRGR